MTHLCVSGDTFQGVVTGLAFGGMGIVRHERFVVFIPFTAPGDRIVYRIVDRKKNYATGELIDLLEPGKDRVAPLCPYFGACGGCQLQHITYDAQIEHKRQSVLDALKRIGHLQVDCPLSIVPAKQVWGYRRHITLTLTAGDDVTLGNTYKMGYIATDKHSLLPIECCPIFILQSPLNTDPGVIQQLDQVVRQMKAHPGSSGRVSILKNHENGYIFSFRFDKVPSNANKVIKQAMSDYSTWKGVTLQTHVYGDIFSKYDIDDLCFQASPEAFIQNNAEQSLNIYIELCRRIVDVGPVDEEIKVLDLYCGIGISSLLLAKRGISVLGIEGNEAAIHLAQKNAQANGLKCVDFLCGDVKELLAKMIRGESLDRFDCVVMNPPRTGADRKIIDFLVQQQVRKIIYISCMPSTLARDLLPLSQAGYRVTHAVAFDMFPQTAHVETLVELCKIM